MKRIILEFIRRVLKIVYSVLLRFRIGREFFDIIMKGSWQEVLSVNHNGINFQFAVPDSLNKYRAVTFSEKEPETLEWIDGIAKGSVLWDIGANVGLYSCYAAKARNCKVFSFEPSVFNLELLSRNIFVNGLSDKIVVLPIPLSDKLSISKLNLTSTDWGGALSTFGKEYGHDGKALKKTFEYQLVGLSIDEVIKFLKIPAPDYIKMDVDGIEQLILAGAKSTLKNVKSVSIEINEDFIEQRRNSEKILASSGLKFKEKRHAEMFNNSIFKNTYNQVWVR
ncbi:FkbM family methyltransferase [Leptospira kanakyensis]|uniref:FkbM family methyltransferase n=1 Tax=Leptospira kanakyensis TaxID=2484968 RepID=A0A6N4QGN4_9LEPT|nr:FkbM family methyltransferase [Leptospira kanakyensis]TGK52047.1 FkbM family methyltransferase [Leptospira kanakyensis]TGK57919.1 FkbM family methyltransferase [Leptospira kanakyensis]TGK71939.1 FkbM family methyltransferase [Leptospira kanakyensis]